MSQHILSASYECRWLIEGGRICQEKHSTSDALELHVYDHIDHEPLTECFWQQYSGRMCMEKKLKTRADVKQHVVIHFDEKPSAVVYPKKQKPKKQYAVAHFFDEKRKSKKGRSKRSKTVAVPARNTPENNYVCRWSDTRKKMCLTHFDQAGQLLYHLSNTHLAKEDGICRWQHKGKVCRETIKTSVAAYVHFCNHLGIGFVQPVYVEKVAEENQETEIPVNPEVDRAIAEIMASLSPALPATPAIPALATVVDGASIPVLATEVLPPPVQASSVPATEVEEPVGNDEKSEMLQTQQEEEVEGQASGFGNIFSKERLDRVFENMEQEDFELEMQRFMNMSSHVTSPNMSINQAIQYLHESKRKRKKRKKLTVRKPKQQSTNKNTKEPNEI